MSLRQLIKRGFRIRLSTITNADRIVVIHSGKVIEQGTHRDLLAKGGYYYRLYKTGFQE